MYICTYQKNIYRFLLVLKIVECLHFDLKSEAYSEPCQTYKRERFAEVKPINYFRQIVHFRCLSGFWTHLWYVLFRYDPARIEKLSKKNIAQVTAGAYHSLAISVQGQVGGYALFFSKTLNRKIGISVSTDLRLIMVLILK